MSINRVSTFKTFGKGRRTSKTLQEIISIISKFAGPATNIKEYSLHNPAGFWSNVCKDLQVPNTLTNRQKILQAYLLQFKDGELPLCHKEEPECPSFSLDVRDTKADSDVVCSPVTDNLESNCASATSDFTEHRQEDTKRSTTQRTNDAQSQLTALWGKNNTEVVVSVVLSQFRKRLLVHHSELLSLRPHNWLTGEVIEYFLHHTVNRLHLEKTIYVLDHYTASVILFEDRSTVRKHSLPKVNFSNYQAIVSFVDINNIHSKFLYISAADVQMHRVYLVDPSSNPAEEADSEAAAQKFREYFQIRTVRHREREWADIEFTGALMQHPVQQDTYSCGVMVMMMAKAVLEAFPKLPNVEFGTTVEEMAEERTAMALELLEASVFDAENNCSMCAKEESPGSGLTDCIRCDSCNRWFHVPCVDMDKKQFEHAKKAAWDCCLCKA